MIGMEQHHWRIVQEILKKYPYTFYAYGSRAKGTQRPTSDLDICFMGSIPYAVQAHIEEDFEESDLPFTVEVADFNLMPEDFKRTISKDLVFIQQGNDIA